MRKTLILLTFIYSQASIAENKLTYNKSDPLVAEFLDLKHTCIPEGNNIPDIPKEAYFVTVKEFIDIEYADIEAKISPHTISSTTHVYSGEDGNFDYVVIESTATSSKPDLLKYSATLQYYKVEPTAFVFAGTYHLQKNGDHRPIKSKSIITRMARSHAYICNIKLTITKSTN